MFEESTTLYKIKLVFSLPEIQGKEEEEALSFVLPMIGPPRYVEEFQGKIEHFHFKIPGPEGFKTEAHTWALEKTSPDKDWGLVYRFTHDLAGVNFAIPFKEIALKALEGNYLLRKSHKLPPRLPVLLAYPLPEMDDEPTMSELKLWTDPAPRATQRQVLSRAKSLLKRELT